MKSALTIAPWLALCCSLSFASPAALALVADGFHVAADAPELPGAVVHEDTPTGCGGTPRCMIDASAISDAPGSGAAPTSPTASTTTRRQLPDETSCAAPCSPASALGAKRQAAQAQSSAASQRQNLTDNFEQGTLVTSHRSLVGLHTGAVAIAEGDAEADILAVSLTGNASSHGRTPTPIVVAAMGNAIAPQGNADGGLTAVAGTGNASNAALALSPVGNSRSGLVALSGVGNANGAAAISGAGRTDGSGVSISGLGDANGGLIVLSATRNASGTVAASGLGRATGVAAASGAGSAGAELLSVSVLGGADGGLVVVSVLGPTSGDGFGVRVWDLSQYAIALEGDAEGENIAIAPQGNASSRFLSIGRDNSYGTIAVSQLGKAQGETAAVSVEGPSARSSEIHGGIFRNAQVGVSLFGRAGGHIAIAGTGEAAGDFASVSLLGKTSQGAGICTGRIDEAQKAPVTNVAPVRNVPDVLAFPWREKDRVDSMPGWAISTIASPCSPHSV